MIRKVSLLLIGGLMGATAMSVIYSASMPAQAAGPSTYKELSIFGDVFERVRAQYVTPPDDEKLVENAINGMLRMPTICAPRQRVSLAVSASK